jgi:hypothetical protein
MTRMRPDGREEPITVEFGEPREMPQEAGIGGWYVTIRFTGLQDDRVYWTNGVDSGQAIALAVCAPGIYLPALPFASEIDLSELPHFGFPVYDLDGNVAPLPRAD